MPGSIKLDGITLATVVNGGLQLNANASPGGIIEQFTILCDGSSSTVSSGTYTSQNVTSGLSLIDDTWYDITGSEITYTPPSNATTVVYTFNFSASSIDAYWEVYYKIIFDGTEVLHARSAGGANNYHHSKHHAIWPFHIGGSTDTNTGRVSSWTTPKTIKMQASSLSTSNEGVLHEIDVWNNDDGGLTFTNQLSLPVIGITALA